ncbi:hypothetical protein ACFE04_004785 [Oxalis oulophora]
MGNSLQPTSEITHTAAQDQELAQQQQQQTEFTCDICIEPTSTASKFNNNNLCTHPFCVDCIAKYIEVKILENTAEIVCPGLNCQHNIDPVSNMSLIPKPLFLKWCDLLCEDSVLSLEKCYCPNTLCMEMVVNECNNSRGTTNVKKSKCPNCKQFFCFDCKKKWHNGFRCEENEAMTRDRNGILLGMLIETNKWQRCPACGHCVQLREGYAGQIFAISVVRRPSVMHIYALVVGTGNCGDGYNSRFNLLKCASMAKTVCIRGDVTR